MSNFADIIVALRDKIGEVFTDPNSIIVTTSNEMPNLVGDKDILLRVRSARKADKVSDAAGRFSMQIRRYVDLVLRVRQYSDVSLQDLRWLIDENGGILDLEVRIMDLLEMWHPEIGLSGDNPDVMLIEPARIESSEEPLRGLKKRQPLDGNDPHFGMLGMRLDIYYEQRLALAAGLV